MRLCGQHVALVLRRGQRAGPRVEQLDGPGARPPTCERERGGGEVGQPVEQRAEQRRVAEHERLGLRVGARRPALDEVAGDGERRAGEADQRHVRRQLAGEDAHRLEHVGRVGLGLERAQAVEVGGARNGSVDDRAGARGDVDAEADGGDRHDDVGVEDGGVDAVAADRLEA